MLEVIDGGKGRVTLEQEIERIKENLESNRFQLHYFRTLKKSVIGDSLPDIDEMISQIYWNDSDVYAPEEYDVVWDAITLGMYDLSFDLDIECKDRTTLHTILKDNYGDPNTFVADYKYASDSHLAGDWFRRVIYQSNCQYYLTVLDRIKDRIEENKKEGNFRIAREIQKIFETQIAGNIE